MQAARLLTTAVEAAFVDGTLVSTEAGGTAGTVALTARVLEALERTSIGDAGRTGAGPG